jgi:hypothetical protein
MLDFRTPMPTAAVVVAIATDGAGAGSATWTPPQGAWRIVGQRGINTTRDAILQYAQAGALIGPPGGTSYVAPADDYAPGPAASTVTGAATLTATVAGADASTTIYVHIALAPI